MTVPVWIEVAITGPSGKARQPRIPIALPDIVADGIALTTMRTLALLQAG